MTEQPDTAIDQPSEVEGVEPVPPEAESPEQAGPEAGIAEHDSTDEHTAGAADSGATDPGDAGTGTLEAETLEAGDSGTGDAGTGDAADTAAPDSEDGAAADVEPGTPQDAESTVEAPDTAVAPDTPATPDVTGTAEAADPTEAQVTEPGDPAAPPASEVDDADADVVAMDSTVPPLDTDAELHHALEAILLVVDSPASEESLATAVDQPIERVTEALRQLAEVYTEDSRGIDLRRAGEGWRFYTRDKYAPFVEKLLMDGQRSKLTRAALETLAVIAYRQPVTRARVAAVRGVNVDGVIRTLIARGLIEEAGTDSETGGILYTTTELFLERLGLSSLADLPPIAPLLPEVDSIDDV